MDLSRVTLGMAFLAISLLSWGQKPEAENLGKAINSEFLELNPVIAPDGKTLYFGRKNHPQNRFGVQGSETIKGSQDIWFSEWVEGAWRPAERMSNQLNRDQYNTILSISPDGQTMLLKGAYEQGLYTSRGFSIAKKTANGWSIPEKIPLPGYEKMNKGKHEYAYLSMDGKVLLLAFSEKRNSDRDDLYISFNQNGSWTRPANLGPRINTAFSETTPFLAADGRTLFFSSDRPGGLGSQDIWVAKRQGRDDWSNWSPAKNLGAPINSEAYDAYYSLSAKGDYAYFLSAKNSLGEKDIFRLALPKDSSDSDSLDAKALLAKNLEPSNTQQGMDQDSSKQGSLGMDKNALAANQKESTKEKIKRLNEQINELNAPTLGASQQADPVVLLSGKVLNQFSKKVPEGAEIIYEDLNTGEALGIAKPDPLSGLYKIVLPFGINYGITAKAKGMIPSSININLSQLSGRYLELEGRDISMAPLVKGAVATINNLFFELNKAELKPASEPELKRLVQVLTENESLKIEISGHTDNTGTDEINNRLSLDRANAVREYLLKAGIAPTRMSSKGFGKTKPKADNATEEGRAINRRVEFVIL